MGTHAALHPTDLMNPKHYRSASAMQADSSHVHHVVVAFHGRSVDATLGSSLHAWYAAWLLLSFVRMLRRQPKIELRVFLKEVRVQLPASRRNGGFSLPVAKELNYTATCRVFMLNRHVVMFRPTDDLRVVAVECVW